MLLKNKMRAHTHARTHKCNNN